MASELETKLRNGADTLVKVLDEAQKLTVETQFVVVTTDQDVTFDNPHPLAKTTITLLGDHTMILPMRQTAAGGLEADQSLLALHLQNVASAVEYRSKVIKSLLDLLSDLTSGRAR